MPRTRHWLPWLWLAAVFALLVAISWKRWANPIVDCGREMYVPWQIAEGKMLYRDLFFMYGPLVPYWHALLFKVFGVHLNVLYAVGLILTAMQATLVLVIARRVLSQSLAVLAAVLFLVQFAVRPSLGNLVFPYSFNAEYASAFNLLALWFVLVHCEAVAAVYDRRNGVNMQDVGGHRPPQQPLLGAGICVGLSLLCKAEIGLAGLLFVLLYLGANLRSFGIRHSAFGIFPALLLPAAGYGWFAWKLGAATLIHEYLWPRAILAQMKLFHQLAVGTLFAPRAIIYLLGLALVTTGGFLVVLLIGHWLHQRAYPLVARLWFVGVGVGLIASPLYDRFVRFIELNHLYDGNFLFLLIALGWVCATGRLAVRNPLLWIALFALLSTWRAPFFAGISGYSAFFMGASVIVFVWVWSEWPCKIWTFDPVPWQRCLLIALAVLCALQVSRHYVNFRLELSYPIATARGEMIVHRETGPALSELIRFLEAKTRPDEPVLLFPEETSLYFLCDRRSPSKYYQFAPALLPTEKEERQLIADADAAHVRFAAVSNRATTEYGKPYFGIDYYPGIHEWLLAHFHLVKTFGNPERPIPPPPPSRYWPSGRYGIDVYERN